MEKRDEKTIKKHKKDFKSAVKNLVFDMGALWDRKFDIPEKVVRGYRFACEVKKMEGAFRNLEIDTFLREMWENAERYRYGSSGIKLQRGSASYYEDSAWGFHICFAPEDYATIAFEPTLQWHVGPKIKGRISRYRGRQCSFEMWIDNGVLKFSIEDSLSVDEPLGVKLVFDTSTEKLESVSLLEWKSSWDDRVVYEIGLENGAYCVTKARNVTHSKLFTMKSLPSSDEELHSLALRTLRVAKAYESSR